MHMIRYATHSDDLTTCIIHKLTYVTIHTFQMFFIYLWTRGFDMEYNV